MDDRELLQQYTENQSEGAFAELVSRHVNLVYSTACRVVGEPQLAQDVAQSVFIQLSQKASSIREGNALPGWLYRATCSTAANTVRSENRRRQRETEAMNRAELDANPQDTWEAIAPLLEEGMRQLNQTEQDAIVLRFFEGKNLREAGAALGLSENAMQKHVSQAVERLRDFFAKRGITTSAAALSVVLTANAVQAAPAGLAVTISTAAAVGGTTVAAAATATATKAIAMTTLQKTLFTATVAVLAGAGIYEAQRARETSGLRTQIRALQQQQAPLTHKLAQLNAENERLSNLVARAATPPVVTNTPPREVLRLRGEVGRLRRELADTTAAKNNADALSEDKAFLKEIRDSFKRGASAKESDLNGALKLDYEQQKSLMNVLSNRVELQLQVYSAMKSGDISASEMRKQLAKLFADEERNIVAMLDTDQQAAYEQMKKEEFARRAKMGAEYEAASMKRLLKLSQEQADAVASVLANIQHPPGSFKSDNEGVLPPDAAEAKQQFETLMVPALQSVLSAEQLQTYRQTRLKQIEEIAQYLEKYYGPSGR